MKSRKKQSGQALLESALILLILLVTLIGIVDFGQFFYFHQSLTDRARAGARYGSIHKCTAPCTAAVNYAIYNDPADPPTAAPLLPCLVAGECASNATVTAVVTNPTTQDGRMTLTISRYPINFILPYFQKSYWTISATGPDEAEF